jgi:hypothetical protein
MNVKSHHECAKECMLLGACVSINFITSNKTCEFNSVGSKTALSSDFNKRKGIIFSNMSEWPKVCVVQKYEKLFEQVQINTFIAESSFEEKINSILFEVCFARLFIIRPFDSHNRIMVHYL